jgi:hypothetical protein
VIVQARTTDGMKGAVFDEDRQCRYFLWRKWNEVGRTCSFIMLNPSYADAEKDDQTIRKCISYAKRWGYGRLGVVNVYPHISTDPKKLDRTLGRTVNKAFLERTCGASDRIICAWGQHAHPDDVKDVQRALDVHGSVYALRLNKDGTPSHPLYLSGSIEPVRFLP